MDDYTLNLEFLDSTDADRQLIGLSYFAVLDESLLKELVMSRLLYLAENAESHVAEVAGSIISTTVAKREHDAVAKLVLKKLKNRDESKIGIRDLEWAAKLNSKALKIALENYLDTCTEPKHISWLVKYLPQHYPDPEQVPLLKTFLTYSDDRIVANTIEGLESINDPSTLSLFAQMLSHASHRVRSVAAGAVARANPEIARRVLFEMLQKADQPEAVKAACHAIKHLVDKDYLELLTPLLKNPETAEEASKTIAWLAYEKIKPILELEAFKNRNDIKSRLASSIIELLREQCRRQFYLRGEDDLSAPDPCTITAEQKKILAFIAQISEDEARKMAESNKKIGLGLFARLIYRPKPEDIVLTSSEARYMPFWHLSCQTTVDYVREKPIKLKLDQNTREIKIGDQYFKVADGRLNLCVDERCEINTDNNIYIDAITGNKIDLKAIAESPSRQLNSIEDILDTQFRVVPARVRASVLLRDILYDIMKPLQAIEIIRQHLKIERLNLCFRPVFAFEYTWKAKDRKVVVEIDGITGKIYEGEPLDQLPDQSFSQNQLFDIGADALGLVVPGGEIAAKIALAFLGKRKG